VFYRNIYILMNTFFRHTVEKNAEYGNLLCNNINLLFSEWVVKTKRMF